MLEVTNSKAEIAMNDYQKNGFVHVPGFLNVKQKSRLLCVVERFHERWLSENEAFYLTRAVNSAYLTQPDYLSDEDRNTLFQMIGSNELKRVASEVFSAAPIFMNTQLFFNPNNLNQQNYWHRDPQYHLTVEQQKAALLGPDVVHFRIALKDELGIELIPGSHKNWDTKEQLDVRLATNGKAVSDDIKEGVRLPLNAGDLLVFSANMIHRGLYGLDRLALDILLCENEPTLQTFINQDGYPDSATRTLLSWPEVFEHHY